MSLLDNASLVLTPNAYKEGKLYSVIPSDGSGDFTFTRATTATRVNSDGLVELVPYNLFTYSEQFDNAAWVKSNVIIAQNSITAPNGTLTADKFVGSATNSTHQMFQTTDSSAYGFSIYAKAGEETTFSMWVANATKRALFDLASGTITISTVTTSSITDVGNGWYRCFVYDPSPTTTYRIYGRNGGVYLGNGTDGLYIWGAQANEGTNALPYQKTETRLNIPRVDYSLGGCPNILLEPQRTNIALQSSSFDSATWLKVASSVTANQIASPSGVQDADKIIATSTLSSHSIYQTIGTVGNSAAISCFVKKAEYRYVNLQYGTAATRFDFDTLTFSGGTNNAYFDYGNGWYRISTVLTATVNARISIAIPDNSGNISYVGDDSSGTFVWGLQAESAASYATSYIPTTTASVTRGADIATNSLLSSLQSNNIIANKGTFLWQTNLSGINEARTIFNLGNVFAVISLADGRTAFRNLVTATYFSLAYRGNGLFKFSVSFNETSASYAINGVIVGTQSIATQSPDFISIFHPSFGIGVIQRLELCWITTEKISDAELVELTTL